MLFYFLFFGCTTCGILVPQPGIEPGAIEVNAPSLNHWTARELPILIFNKDSKYLSGGKGNDVSVGNTVRHLGSDGCVLDTVGNNKYLTHWLTRQDTTADSPTSSMI